MSDITSPSASRLSDAVVQMHGSLERLAGGVGFVKVAQLLNDQG